MNERKKRIITEAMKLFAQKGFHATSVQEIVDHCDMSKGSFYNYFKSKEELIVSIFQYHYTVMFENIVILDDDDTLGPRERFIKQITMQIIELNSNQDFFRMLLREQAPAVHEEIQELMIKMRSSTLNWHTKKLREIYPNLSEEHLYDCATILGGIIHGFVIYFVIDQHPLTPDHIAVYLLNRMDSIVHGLKKEDEPILKKEFLQDLLNYSGADEGSSQLKLRYELSSLQKKLEKDSHSKLTALVEAIDLEVGKDNPQPIVLEGLLLLLDNEEYPAALSEEIYYCKKLIQEFIVQE